jgi:nucleoside-diphosphate-sugar epimerase
VAEPGHLLILGLGYSGSAIAAAAAGAGFRVTGTSRRADHLAPPGVTVVPFDAAAPAIATATHIVPTAAPEDGGDPMLARYGAEIATAPSLRWIGFLSSTGVYGDRDGGWVDERSEPRPTSLRARARRAAEEDWARLGAARGTPVDLIRLAGIYGPGRSAFDDLRAGRARRIDKPGHEFGRIHRQDIAEGTLAAMRQAERLSGLRVLNFNDDLPAEPAVVVAEAARLLGVAPPPLIPFAEAAAGMSTMGRSFWSERRRVSSGWTQTVLGRPWRYPSYVEGLAAIHAEDTSQR